MNFNGQFYFQGVNHKIQPNMSWYPISIYTVPQDIKGEIGFIAVISRDIPFPDILTY